MAEARRAADLLACLCLAGALSRRAERVALRVNVDRICMSELSDLASSGHIVATV